MHLYSAARAPDTATCDYHLEKIKGLDAVAGQELADIPRNTWAMSATRGNTVWNQVTSYMSESTNNYVGAEVSSSMCLRPFVGVAAIVYRLPVPSCCKLWDTSDYSCFFSVVLYLVNLPPLEVRFPSSKRLSLSYALYL